MTRATLDSIARNLAAVRVRMQAAAVQAGRNPASVRLLAVSKSFPATSIAAAYSVGQVEFGENYLQEALPKLETLKHHPGLIWHYIGTLQTNKTRLVAEHFDWVHTVDRERIGQRLSEQRPTSHPPLNVCIQVRLGNEPGKSGILPERVATLAEYLTALPCLHLRGLMCIPPPAQEMAAQRIAFQQLRMLFETLNNQGLALDTLSMGMSADYEAAIMEGSTIVRVGTAIFGERTRKNT